jgi:hypothetical protein
MKKLIFILVVLALASLSFGKLMSELNYDVAAFPENVQTAWDYLDGTATGYTVAEYGVPDPQPDPESGLNWPTRLGPTGYARLLNGTQCNYYTPGSGITTEGRVEISIAPDWGGVNTAGGTGLGGVGSSFRRHLLYNGVGTSPPDGMIRIFMEDDGAGDRVIATLNDGATTLTGPNGSIDDWAAGSWHNVSFEWDATNVRLFVDSVLVEEEARGGFTGIITPLWAFGQTPSSGITHFSGLADNIRLYDTAIPNTATLPVPLNGATVDKSSTLSWRAGNGAITHEVYWSAVEAEVTGRTITPITLTVAIDGNSTPTPSTPTIGTTYYWAVDEIDSSTTHTGDLWTYTTEDFIYVDDMEGYDLEGESTGNEIWNVWDDGHPISGLDNGSAVVGTTDALSGTGAMEYKYSNTGTSPYGIPASAYYSEIAADTSDPNLTCGSDWTANGITWLLVNFKGLAGNDANEQMYIVIEDSTPTSAIVKYGLPDGYSNQTNPVYAEDMNNIAVDGWHQWAIDLRSFTGVNLADVQNVYIGFGVRGNTTTAGGAGTVIFDDIKLVQLGAYGIAESLATDLFNDGEIDYGDISIFINYWLTVENDGIWPKF